MPDFEPAPIDHGRNDTQLMERIRILDALYLVDGIRKKHPDQAQDFSYFPMSAMDITQSEDRVLLIDLRKHWARLWEVKTTDHFSDRRKLAEVSVPTVQALICVLEIGIGESNRGSRFLDQV